MRIAFLRVAFLGAVARHRSLGFSLHELPYVRVLASCHGALAALPDESAVEEECGAVCCFVDAAHVVGDRDGGGAERLGAIDDELVDEIGGDGIEPAGGFVEEQDIGIGCHGARDGDAFAHAS